MFCQYYTVKHFGKNITVHTHKSNKFERSRLEMMQGDAEVRDCRCEYLLNYFGEKFEGLCGFCDHCKAGITGEEVFASHLRWLY